MGQLTDTLQATLRDLARSDARLYRGFQEELSDTPSTTSPPPALEEGDARASREELEGLSVAALWSLCKARGIKGLSRGPLSQQVDALLSHADGPPLRSSLPLKATRGSKPIKRAAVAGKASTNVNAVALHVLEQRLDRLDHLLLLIAQQVGVSPKAIERLLPPSSPES